MQRNMADTMRRAHAALMAGDFAMARDLAAPATGNPAGAVLHALACAGCNEPDSAATLAAIARANPAARHPVLDLAELLRTHGRPTETAAHLRAAVHLTPGNADLLDHLGAALAETGPVDEAIDAFRRATAIRPDHAATWSNLGKALAATGRFSEAETAFGHARTLAPNDSQLTLNHAVARLKSGRLPEAWPLFRARHRLPGRPPPPPGPELTSLDGIAGRTVLLLHDEGFGDTIQFIRYAPLLSGRGARVLASVPSPLARLLASNGIDLAPAPYDAWCRIADLPGVFGTTLDTIPAHLPYLRPDPALVALWAQRLPAGRRIGLVWAGAARRHDPAAAATDRIRSIPRGSLTPLLATPGIAWISLQHGQAAPPDVFDPMPKVADFADTAAIIASLQTVVTVDTAVAHLAAAMAVPTILLDRYDNCWRWLSGREDSPWYPGALRIIRQTKPGDWPDVLAQAASTMIR